MENTRDALRSAKRYLQQIVDMVVVHETESQELLSPLGGSTSGGDALMTPKKKTSTISFGTRKHILAGGTENSSVGESMALKMKAELIEKLKEDVEVALVCSKAVTEKLMEIHGSISSEEESKKLARSMKKKVGDVWKVAKKGVLVEKVTEFRIVER